MVALGFVGKRLAGTLGRFGWVSIGNQKKKARFWGPTLKKRHPNLSPGVGKGHVSGKCKGRFVAKGANVTCDLPAEGIANPPAEDRCQKLELCLGQWPPTWNCVPKWHPMLLLFAKQHVAKKKNSPKMFARFRYLGTWWGTGNRGLDIVGLFFSNLLGLRYCAGGDLSQFLRARQPQLGSFDGVERTRPSCLSARKEIVPLQDRT